MIRQILIVLFLSFVCLPQAASAKAGFREALDAHFQAVVARDIDKLEPTLTRSDELTLILPNGKRTTTKAAFLEFHRTWFAETGWTMRFDIHTIVENGTTAIATVQTRYDEPNATKPYWSESWLTLTFRKERGEWRLFHDQNTRIRTSESAAS
jgi:ketosteroid isomerase-like protein